MDSFFALPHDIVFGYYLGPAVLAVTAAGIAVLILREFTNIENIFNALFMMLFSTWLYATVYWGSLQNSGKPVQLCLCDENTASYTAV